MSETIKCLSVKQPWAELIVRGLKDVENRKWSREYRGPLLIHASLRIDRIAWDDLPNWDKVCDWLHEIRSGARGAIIGVCNLSNITSVVSSDWHEPGYCGWYFTHASRFDTPIPYKGQLGLFNVPIEVVRHLLTPAGK